MVQYVLYIPVLLQPQLLPYFDQFHFILTMNVGQNNGIIGHESLNYLLSSFNEALSKEDQPLCDNAEYMQLVELHFLIKKYGCLTYYILYK